MVVVDASAAASLAVELPWTAEVRSRVDPGEPFIAPMLFVAELGNALWRNERAGVLDRDWAVRALRRTLALVRLVADQGLGVSAYLLASEFRHPIYDCFYLALASREGIPLLTADRRLGALAARVGVEAIVVP